MRTEIPPWPVLLVLVLGVIVGGTTIGWDRIPETLMRYGLNVNIGGWSRSTGFPSVGEGSLEVTVNGRRTRDLRRGVWARAGSTLAIRYRAEVNRGRLHIGVVRNGLRIHQMWSADVEISGESSHALPLETTGNYEIVVQEWGYDGSYAVRWEVL